MAPEPAQRRVTVLLSEAPPDSDRALQRAALSILGNHGATVRQVAGDRITAVFGWPKAHENEVERAIRAALEIAQNLGGPTGLATGHAAMDQPSAAAHELDDLAGRLADAAGPDRVLVCSTTRMLAQRGFLFERHAAPIQGQDVFAVVDEQVRSRNLGLQTAGRLVGREKEMRLLEDAWAAATTGRGSARLIVAEAGLGKSRLALELIRRVRSTAAHVRVLRCSPFWVDRPLAPLAAVDERMTPALREHLAKALGDDAELVQPYLDGKGGSGIGAATAESRERLLDGLARAHAFLAEDRPLLLVVEDLHWADATTREWLARMASSTARAPALLVVTSRPGAASGRLAEHASITELAPLSTESIELLASRAIGRSLTPAELADVVARADGVPLFAEELARSVPGERRGEASTRQPGSVPAMLYSSLMARLDSRPEALDVLRTAACIGRQFDLPTLAAASGLEMPQGMQRVRRGIEALVAEAIILPESGRLDEDAGEDARDDAGSFQFRHALLRDAAYESMPADLARETHRRIAASIQHGSVESDGLDRLLHHHLQAGDIVAALTCAIGIVDRNLGQYELEAAEAVARRALDLIAGLGDARAARIYRLQLLRRISHLLYLRGMFAESAAILEAEHDDLATGDDPDLSALTLAQLAHIQARIARYAEARRTALLAIEQATAAGNDEAAGRAWGIICLLAAMRGDRDGSGLRAGRRSLEHLRLAQAPFWLGMSVFYLGMLAMLEGRLSDALAVAVEVAEIGATNADARLGCYASFLTAWAEAMAGRHDLARAAARQACDLAPDPTSRAYARAFLGLSLLEAGDDDACTALDDAVDQLMAINYRPFVGYFLGVLADAERIAGHRERARRILDQAQLEASDGAYVAAEARVAWVEGKLAFDDQRPEAARQALTRARIALEEAGAGLDLARLMLDLGAVERASGRPDIAAEHQRGAMQRAMALAVPDLPDRYVTGLNHH